MMVLMQEGTSWQEAARRAGVQTSRSTAYRWFAVYQTQGEAAFHDGRHGHSAKVREPVLQWLAERCRSAPQTASSRLQKELQEHFGVKMSITHLNRIRAAHGLSRRVARAGKKSCSDLIYRNTSARRCRRTAPACSRS